MINQSSSEGEFAYKHEMGGFDKQRPFSEEEQTRNYKNREFQKEIGGGFKNEFSRKPGAGGGGIQYIREESADLLGDSFSLPAGRHGVDIMCDDKEEALQLVE